MNKRKRVARLKHRMKRKKLEEKHRREKGLPVHQAAGRAGAGGRREHSP
jgi:hypothetical protein